MSALVTSALIAGASSLAAAGGSSIAASKMNARAEKYNRWALKETATLSEGVCGLYGSAGSSAE